MSELVVVGFDGTEVADRVLLKLAGLKRNIWLIWKMPWSSFAMKTARCI